jgi:hypothetical protein
LRLLVFSLTGLAVFLCISQFTGSKGTRAHIAKGIMVGIVSLVVITINTVDISLRRGLSWDLPFIIHTFIGTLFFLSLIATCIFGFLSRGKGRFAYKPVHQLLATMTGTYLSLALLAAIIIRFFR